MNNARLGKADDPKEHPIPVVVKETIVALSVCVMPLGRLRSGKFNNRVQKPLATNAGHLILSRAFHNLIRDPIDLRRQIPA